MAILNAATTGRMASDGGAAAAELVAYSENHRL
jgi:hypothetical protein